MEINEIRNNTIKEKLANTAIKILLGSNLITNEELLSIKVNFGYVFRKEDEKIEALFKVRTTTEKNFYFALQNDKLILVKTDEQSYQNIITTMKRMHPCLADTSVKETEEQYARRIKNNEYLKSKNISYSESLPCKYNIENTRLKDMDTICRRAIACLIVVQIACDINNGEYEESKKCFLPLLKKYDVEMELNEKERRILEGDYSRQDVIDMDWAYEAYWALCWCLGLVDDISNASELCDCKKATDLVIDSSSFEEFKNKCRLRSINEILDMEDLYYRMHWTINESKVNTKVSIEKMDVSNVIERRRALEWVLQEEKDWYKLNLNA